MVSFKHALSYKGTHTDKHTTCFWPDAVLCHSITFSQSFYCAVKYYSKFTSYMFKKNYYGVGSGVLFFNYEIIIVIEDNVQTS